MLSMSGWKIESRRMPFYVPVAVIRQRGSIKPFKAQAFPEETHHPQEDDGHHDPVDPPGSFA
jgi:hypothetical protein